MWLKTLQAVAACAVVCMASVSSEGQAQQVQSPEAFRQASNQCPPQTKCPAPPRCERPTLSCEELATEMAHCPNVMHWCVTGPEGRLIASYSDRADAEACMVQANELGADGNMAWASGHAACGVQAYDCTSSKSTDQTLMVKVQACLAPVGAYCKSGCVRFNSSECFQGCTSWVDKPQTWNHSALFGYCAGSKSGRFYTNNSKKKCESFAPAKNANCPEGFGPTPK